MSKKSVSKSKNEKASPVQPAKAAVRAAAPVKTAPRPEPASPPTAPATSPANKSDSVRATDRGTAQSPRPLANTYSAALVPGATTSQPRPGANTERDVRLPAAGTTLVKRDRLGQPRCECKVEADGIRYKGTLHRSLSAAASAAATDLGINARVNGFVFWGLVKPARPAKDHVAHLRKLGARYHANASALLKQGSVADIQNEVRRDLRAHAAQLTELLAESATAAA